MSASIKTDILIIGAGPVGLFAVFEAGLLKLKCHLVDVLAQPGGQLTEIYPKKPIYDIPGYPTINADELVQNLMEQIKPFKPGFTLGERVDQLEKLEDGNFRITTNKGTHLEAPIIFIAAGLGSFEPRKPPIANLTDWEEKGVEYIIKDPLKFKDKVVVIAGGGDSALDWAIYLAKIAKKVVMVHRRTEFRGHLDSVQKVTELAETGVIDLFTNSEVINLDGDRHINKVLLQQKDRDDQWINTDYFLPLFGLTPKLGPLANWGLELDKIAILVNNTDYQTSIPGIYAIGDINTYQGKLKLILCGFHEATLACQSAFKIINPGKSNVLKYTTVNGVQGF